MFFALGLAFAVSCTPAPEPPPAASFPGGELVDLSHTYDQSTIFWPTSDTFRLEKVAEGVTPAGYYYAANNFFTAEHGGTHIDSPVHFAEGHQTVDRIPLERLVGPAVVVDVTGQADRDADYQVTIADIEEAERRDGGIPADSIVLLRTGFSQRWPDAARYLGTAERGADAVARLHFPGLHPDAARWLVANGGRARSASTRPASTTASRRNTSRTARSSSVTSPPSRTSPPSSACRAGAHRSSRCR
jgi:kynurenine formamidase